MLSLPPVIYHGAGRCRFPGYFITVFSVKLRRRKRKKGELNLPLIYLMVVGVCGLFFYLLHLLNRIPKIPCAFRTFTGCPCPTCGSTRVVLNLFNLDICSAFHYNPLFFLLSIIFIVWTLYGFYMLFSGKHIELALSKKEGLFFRFGLAILFLLNWVYLIAAGV